MPAPQKRGQLSHPAFSGTLLNGCRRVASPRFDDFNCGSNSVAECQLPKLNVAGSTPVSRSTRFFVYILHSSTLDRYYIGMTCCPGTRLKQHRRGQSAWTSRASDWREVFRLDVDSHLEARALEKAIKARGAKRFLLETASQSRQ